MRVALVNPNWDFAGSIYFGCREPHLPLEFGYAAALLTPPGITAAIVDAQAEGLDAAHLRERVAAPRAGHDRDRHCAELSVLALCPA